METRESGLTRRSFLQGVSVAAIGAAGLSLVGCGANGGSNATGAADNEATGQAKDVWAIEKLAEPSETIKVDVCVVGGGGTGSAAALEAKELGLDVVILEKKAAIGGSFIGTEGMFGVETHWTKEAGETLTVEQAIENCLVYHHYWPNHLLYKNFFDQTAETVLWLEDHGMHYREVVKLGISHQSWHVYEVEGDSGPGVLFMQNMAKALDKAGVPTRLQTSAKKIVMENGKVAGVLAVKKDGSVLKVEAKAVVIGTGGYANNNDVIYAISPATNERIHALGMDGRDADGLKMAKDAGAAFCEFPGTVMWCGPVAIGAEWTSNAYSASVQPTLWVNQDAQRFVKEDLWIDDFVAAGIALNNQKKGYVIFTEDDMKHFETVGPYGQVFSFAPTDKPLPKVREQLEKLKSVHKCNTVEDMAKAVGIDAAALKATIDRYNSLCSGGVDEDFGKKSEHMTPVASGPFWILEVQNGFYTTVGGIKISPNTEVLGTDGAVIPGLYAGGSDAGGLYGDSYDVSRAPGSQASWAINSGRLAAKSAAKYLGA
ncbi:MAG: FAD-dependent oxidoreductase [Coriobacteriia bacterium]